MSFEDKILAIKAHVKSYDDFPKTGVIFRDLFPVFRAPKVFRTLIDVFKEHVNECVSDVDAVIGIEARGFLLGPILALELNIPFIPIRKKGKLPGKLRKVRYALEYGEDSIEIQEESVKPGMKCLIIDDLLATGGTLASAVRLINECNATVAECLVAIELVALNGRKQISVPIYSVVQY